MRSRDPFLGGFLVLWFCACSSISRTSNRFLNVYAQSVLVELKFTGTSPNPSEFTSISTVVEQSRLSASNRNLLASATYCPDLVIIVSQIRESAK